MYTFLFFESWLVICPLPLYITEERNQAGFVAARPALCHYLYFKLSLAAKCQLPFPNVRPHPDNFLLFSLSKFLCLLNHTHNKQQDLTLPKCFPASLPDVQSYPTRAPSDSRRPGLNRKLTNLPSSRRSPLLSWHHQFRWPRPPPAFLPRPALPGLHQSSTNTEASSLLRPSSTSQPVALPVRLSLLPSLLRPRPPRRPHAQSAAGTQNQRSSPATNARHSRRPQPQSQPHAHGPTCLSKSLCGTPHSLARRRKLESPKFAPHRFRAQTLAG